MVGEQKRHAVLTVSVRLAEWREVASIVMSGRVGGALVRTRASRGKGLVMLRRAIFPRRASRGRSFNLHIIGRKARFKKTLTDRWAFGGGGLASLRGLTCREAVDIFRVARNGRKMRGN